MSLIILPQYRTSRRPALPAPPEASYSPKTYWNPYDASSGYSVNNEGRNTYKTGFTSWASIRANSFVDAATANNQFEFVQVSGGDSSMVGIAKASASLTGSHSDPDCYLWFSANGSIYGGGGISKGVGYGGSDKPVIVLKNGKLYFGINGVVFGDLAAETGWAVSGITGMWAPMHSSSANGMITRANFLLSDFEHTPQAGVGAFEGTPFEHDFFDPIHAYHARASNENKDIAGISYPAGQCYSGITHNDGKYRVQFEVTSYTASIALGISLNRELGSAAGYSAGQYAFWSGQGIFTNGILTVASAITFTAGDIVDLLIDNDTGLLELKLNDALMSGVFTAFTPGNVSIIVDMYASGGTLSWRAAEDMTGTPSPGYNEGWQI